MNTIRWNLLAWTLLSSVLVSHTVLASPKAWLAEQRIVIDHGAIQVMMTKDAARNVDWGSFYADVSNRTNDIRINFRGPCRPFMNIKVRAATRRLDLAAFLNSRSGQDLPIHDTLDVMRATLSEQCEGLQVLRLKFASSHYTTEDYTYVGTMTKANNWQLQDGIVATNFDHEYRFEFSFRDVFSVAGVYYKGTCTADPVLTVQPRYANNSERALAKKPDFASYNIVAKHVAIIYADHCPQITSIKFILSPIPQDYKCEQPGDCFLVAEKKKEWVVDASQLTPKKYYSPIHDFNDFVEILAAGEHHIIDDYQSYFAFFFESFIGIYSDQCKSHIQNPVGRTIQPIERRYDSNGFLIDERNAGPKREIWVEQSYASNFDRYFGSWKAWGTKRMLNSMISNNPNRQLGRIWQSTTTAIGFFTRNYNTLENTVRNQCSDGRLQAAYANMLNYANRQPAIKGRFKTDKKPLTKTTKNGISAPHAAKQLEAEKAAQGKEKSAAQLADEANQQRKAEERQQRIRDEIAKRNAPRHAQPTQPADTASADRANELQLKYMQKLKENMVRNREFQTQLRDAKTPQQRAAIQAEFQAYQKESAAQMKQLGQDFQQSR